jgi:hypothetical protein
MQPRDRQRSAVELAAGLEPIKIKHEPGNRRPTAPIAHFRQHDVTARSTTLRCRAGGGTRTRDLLITNSLGGCGSPGLSTESLEAVAFYSSTFRVACGPFLVSRGPNADQMRRRASEGWRSTSDSECATHFTSRPERSRGPTFVRDPAILLRGDRCALLQGKRDGALGEDKEGTSPSVLSDLPACPAFTVTRRLFGGSLPRAHRRGQECRQSHPPVTPTGREVGIWVIRPGPSSVGTTPPPAVFAAEPGQQRTTRRSGMGRNAGSDCGPTSSASYSRISFCSRERPPSKTWLRDSCTGEWPQGTDGFEPDQPWSG